MLLLMIVHKQTRKKTKIESEIDIRTLVLVLLRLRIQLKMVYRFRSIVVPLDTVVHRLVAVLLFSEASEL